MWGYGWGYGLDDNDPRYLGSTFKGYCETERNDKIAARLKKDPSQAILQDRRHGRTGLHYCARDNNLEGAQLLLASEASVNCKDKSYWTPLHCAAYAGNHKVLELLLKQEGANVNGKEKEGMTSMHLAARFNRPECIRVLVQYGGDVGATTLMENKTPLHAACERDAGEAAVALLEAGADPDPLDSLHETPLHWAAAHDSPEIALLLVQRGADPNRRESGNGGTCFHLACKKYNDDTAMVLLAYSHMDAENKYGKSAIDDASYTMRKRIRRHQPIRPLACMCAKRVQVLQIPFERSAKVSRQVVEFIHMHGKGPATAQWNDKGGTYRDDLQKAMAESMQQGTGTQADDFDMEAILRMSELSAQEDEQRRLAKILTQPKDTVTIGERLLKRPGPVGKGKNIASRPITPQMDPGSDDDLY